MKFIFRIFLLIFPVILSSQSSFQKINGISIYPLPKKELSRDMIASVEECGVNWVAFVPEVILDRESLTFLSEKEMTDLGRRREEILQGITIAKSIGLKVMLKPHVEISAPIPVEEETSFFDFFSFGGKEKPISEKDKTNGATWRGDFTARNETDWKTWEQCYERFILKWAKQADSLSVDLFCIGTELKMSATLRPQFWRQLIIKVRTIYNGSITYAANWDEYEQVEFWSSLDYIGIDAYFPISESATPKVGEVITNWKPISQKLKELSKKHQRKVLITEIGYRNVSHAGREPWTHDKGQHSINNESQVNLYEGFFQTFGSEDYIAGSFLWQWILEEEERNTSFSPRGKTAMRVLNKYYRSE